SLCSVDLLRVRHYKELDPIGPKNPAHLTDVRERHRRLRKVLEDDERMADVGALALDRSQRSPVAQDPFDVAEVGVQPSSPIEHPLGDVEGANLGAALGQSARDPTEAAADLD